MAKLNYSYIAEQALDVLENELAIKMAPHEVEVQFTQEDLQHSIDAFKKQVIEPSVKRYVRSAAAKRGWETRRWNQANG